MNEKDPIEELFRENQHGLEESPRDLIWDRIAERLDEKQLAKKKNNWWKYGTVASILVGLTISVWAILNNPNNFNSEISAPQIVFEEPMEVNEENASEILDKLEENKQSVVIREEKKSAPDVIENEMENIPEPISLKIPEPMKSEAVHDVAPMAEMSTAPAMESSKKLEEGEVVVFQGESQKKKEDNYTLQSKSKSQKYEKEDTRRLGNMAETSGVYEYKNQQNKISIPLKNSLIQYDLISRTDSSVLFQNEKIAYPNQIILTHANDSVSVIYSGKENKKNSKESQNIQNYIKENKSQIVSDFGLK